MHMHTHFVSFTAASVQNAFRFIGVRQDSDVHLDVHRRTLFAQYDYRYSFSRIYVYQIIFLYWVDSSLSFDSNMVDSYDMHDGKVS